MERYSVELLGETDSIENEGATSESTLTTSALLEAMALAFRDKGTQSARVGTFRDSVGEVRAALVSGEGSGDPADPYMRYVFEVTLKV